MSTKVYFTKEITPESLIRIYEALGVALPGKIGVKISTGEKGGNNYLKPALIGPLVQKLNANILECNTAYRGKRNTVEEHLEVAKEHGFTDIAAVDILDADGEIALPIKVPDSITPILDVDYVGDHLKNYDSVVNLSHFKGHAMGGFGGTIKNQSIGFASRNGKAYIHGAGTTRDPDYVWAHLAKQLDFLKSMAEAAKAVQDYFTDSDGTRRILYIDVMNNLSVDCDCDSSPEDPCMADIGILASTDPVALDQACIDLIWSSEDRGRDHFIKRVERQQGREILPYAESIGLGSRDYELVEI